MGRKWRVGWWEEDENNKVVNRGTSGELNQDEAEAAVRGIRATDRRRHAVAMEEEDEQDRRGRRRR
jgi:PBP1b-binding outer membrane lipoprotein LpoB